jgi:2-amino-4-hydroxy-6-hydroxymethyldihydropteridine diphosphokinase
VVTPNALVAIGSNIDARCQVPWVLEQLLEHYGLIHVGRIIETEPVGMVDGSGVFLNGVVAFHTDESRLRLKERLVALEQASGRDREATNAAQRARTLDLDILCFGTLNNETLEPWNADITLELLAELTLGERPASCPAGILLEVQGRQVGRKPALLEVK